MSSHKGSKVNHYSRSRKLNLVTKFLQEELLNNISRREFADNNEINYKTFCDWINAYKKGSFMLNENESSELNTLEARIGEKMPSAVSEESEKNLAVSEAILRVLEDQLVNWARNALDQGYQVTLQQLKTMALTAAQHCLSDERFAGVQVSDEWLMKLFERRGLKDKLREKQPSSGSNEAGKEEVTKREEEAVKETSLPFHPPTVLTNSSPVSSSSYSGRKRNFEDDARDTSVKKAFFSLTSSPPPLIPPQPQPLNTQVLPHAALLATALQGNSASLSPILPFPNNTMPFTTQLPSSNEVSLEQLLMSLPLNPSFVTQLQLLQQLKQEQETQLFLLQQLQLIQTIQTSNYTDYSTLSSAFSLPTLQIPSASPYSDVSSSSLSSYSSSSLDATDT